MPYIARTHQLSQSLLYHIFNRGNGRSEIFHDDKDYSFFIKLLSDYSNRHNISIYHWVLMPNHYHLLLELNEPEKISSIMAGLARAYVYYHHKKYQSSGHLWQGRFKSQPVEKDLYLFSCGRYIERNPLKANMVASAEEYPYSSASFYVFGKKDSFTIQNPLFETFGNQPQQRQKEYQEFLKTFDSEEEQLFENLEFPQGSKEFINRLIKDRGLYLPRRKGRARKNTEAQLAKGAERIVKLAEQGYIQRANALADSLAQRFGSDVLINEAIQAAAQKTANALTISAAEKVCAELGAETIPLLESPEFMVASGAVGIAKATGVKFVASGSHKLIVSKWGNLIHVGKDASYGLHLGIGSKGGHAAWHISKKAIMQVIKKAIQFIK